MSRVCGGADTLWTFPGKLGDSFHQWPIAYHWAKEQKQQIVVGLDRTTLQGAKSLFAAQKCVEEVILLDGIKAWNIGGQPWNFGFTGDDYKRWRGVVHLGFHFMPNEQLTYFVRKKFGPLIEVDDRTLEEEQSIYTGERKVQSRVLLHGQAKCPHTRKPPAFWGVLDEIAPMLERFEQKVFIGLPQDVPNQRPDGWTHFEDGGDWLTLARYMNNSALVIGVGSAPVALAGAMKVPCIRIHDTIGGQMDLDYRIWSNLGSNQINLYRPEGGYKPAIERFLEEKCPTPSAV